MKKIWPIPEIQILPLKEWCESRPVGLVYSLAAWQAVQPVLNLPVVSQVEVREATTEYWDGLLPGLQGEVLYAVGGGLPADAAKYLAAKSGRPLVCVPTALSVDAILTCASGIRQEGCVRYLETTTPATLVVDFDVIGAAPASLRAAGICDLLSIATGSWDWRYANQQGRNPPGMEYISYVDQAAQALLKGTLDCAEAAGRGEPEGLKQLLDCLALEVQLCNQIGHSRPEEGSEHYFAYAVENVVGHGLPHGDLVGPGIIIMAEIQGQDTKLLRKALEACHIRLDGIPQEVIKETLRILPEYATRHQLPYAIAHTLRSDQ